MSSFRNKLLRATALLGLWIGVAHAAPTPTLSGQPHPIPAHDLKIWHAEANDFGKHPLAKPKHPPGYYQIGTAPTQPMIAGWSITAFPNGVGLPAGQGTVAQGATLFASSCAMCHGTFGEGKNAYPQLVGGVGSLKSAAQTKTLGSYWPFANTVWDYINRAMPFYAPHTLKPDQVYALTAYLLNMNGIVHGNFVADAHSLPAVKMPDRNGWNWRDPRPVTHNVACMDHCVKHGPVRITSNAANTNLTPRLTGPVDHMKNGK